MRRRSCSARLRSPRAVRQDRVRRLPPGTAGSRPTARRGSRSRSARRQRGRWGPAARAPSLHPALPVVGGRTRATRAPGRARTLSPTAGCATASRSRRPRRPRYRVAAGDRGQALACRVHGEATDGPHRDATSSSARARPGLGIGTVTLGRRRRALRRAALRRQRAALQRSLRVLVAGRPIARGRFALHSPGGVVQLGLVEGARRPASGELATVLVACRNRAGAARTVLNASCSGTKSSGCPVRQLAGAASPPGAKRRQ